MAQVTHEDVKAQISAIVDRDFSWENADDAFLARTNEIARNTTLYNQFLDYILSGIPLNNEAEDFQATVWHAAAKYGQLTSIDLHESNLGHHCVFEIIESNTNLNDLTLSSFSFDDNDVSKLIDIINSVGTLKEITLVKSNISAENRARVAEAVQEAAAPSLRLVNNGNVYQKSPATTNPLVDHMSRLTLKDDNNPAAFKRFRHE